MTMQSIELLDDEIYRLRLEVRKIDGYSQALAMYKNHYAELRMSFLHFGEQFIQTHAKEPLTKEKIKEFNDRIESSRDLLAQKTAIQALSYMETIIREIFLDEEKKEETSVEFINEYDMREYFETEKVEDRYEIAWEPAKSSLQYFVDRRSKIIASHKDAIDVLDMKDLKWLNLRIRHNKHSFYRSITFYNNHIYVFMNDIISNIEMRPAALVEESFDEVQKMIAEELAPKLKEFGIDPNEYVRKIETKEKTNEINERTNIS